MNTKTAILFISFVIILTTITGVGCATEKNTTSNTVDNQKPIEYESKLMEFDITAKKWEFTPSTLIVRQGDKVKIKITSTDVTHSFVMKDYGINITIKPNETKVAEFVADRYGIFNFNCGIPCGSGHKDMVGVLVVK